MTFTTFPWEWWGSGPVQIPTPADPPTPADGDPNLYHWNGSAWELINVFEWDGAQWVEMEADVYYWDGAAWDT